MPRFVRRVVVIAALTALTAGCAEESPDPVSADPTPRETATSTPSESSTPSLSSSPSVTESAPVQPRTLDDRLLPADELPGFNETFTWQEESTKQGDPTVPSQQCGFGLFAIGGSKVVHRSYVPAVASRDRAFEVVGEFPDVVTAKRAYSSLSASYAKCSVDHDGDPTVGPFTPVTFDNGAVGGWHLLTYGTTFDAQGFTRRGRYIALVVLRLEDAQDYNSELGQEPMVAALQRAAELL